MPAVFEQAARIAPPESLSQAVNTYYEYEATLSLSQGRGDLVLHIAAHTDYAFEVDGKLLAFGQFADYGFAPVYDTVSLPPLGTGTHEVHITVYHTGQSTSRVRNRATYLLFEIKDGDGAVLLASAPGMKVRLHPHYRSGQMEQVSGQLGFTFAYDATLPETPFVQAVDAGMAPLAIPRPVEKLTVSENKATTLLERGYFKGAEGSLGARAYHARPNATAADADGIWARYDLGHETTGILSLDITVDAPCEILCAWGEHLDDGRVRALIGSRNFTCAYRAHAGRNVFVAPFLRLGLRYLEIYIAQKKATIHYAGVKETLYPLQERLPFRCDDEIHNRIYDISLRTLHLCMHEHYEDCPWREQALYTMDSRNQMLCGYYAFGETRFARASLELIAASLRPDHLLELCSPAEVSITIPSFSAMFLTQMAEYLRYTQDRDFTERLLPVMTDIAEDFIARTHNEAGLLTEYPDKAHWNFYEWQTGLSGQIGGTTDPDAMCYDAPLCAFVSMGLGSLAEIFYAFGRLAEGRRYEAAQRALNEAMNRAFWCEAQGAYASFKRVSDGSLSHYAELTNALMLYAGAVPKEREATLCALLASDDGSLLPVTLSHSIFKYEVLLRHGGYHKYVFDRIAKVFGAMLEKGATTFWETKQGGDDFGMAGSLCHGWSAIPVYLYHKYALNPTEETGIQNARVAMR